MAIVRNVVKANYYRDSLQLLHLSEEAKKIEGVKDAAVVMATSTNKELLSRLKLLTTEGLSASSSDLIIAVMADSESAIDYGLSRIEASLTQPPTTLGVHFHSIDAALQSMPEANLAIVSIPGEHAKNVVTSLLDRGLNVHLFSDHVPQEDELELKQLAKAKGLLVMGPGAGTSIIAGKAIAFANIVRKGGVGIVAAAGTGLQEVSVLVNNGGLGISQAIGTGGRDVKDKIGGITTLQAIEALEKDTATSIIVIVTKPPDASVREKILNRVRYATTKPIITCFLGEDGAADSTVSDPRLSSTKTLHAAAIEILKRSSPQGTSNAISVSPRELFEVVDDARSGVKGRQRYVRGLYTGGTLAYEAIVILSYFVDSVYSNAPLNPRFKLPSSSKSLKDSILDLGEEEFTLGRAHPMIDPTIRKMRLIEEARDPEVSVIIMDVMLGYGSHPDPAGAMCDSISEAQRIARGHERALPILAHVCGTDQDPQSKSDQIRKLQTVGVKVFPTNALMVTASALISRGDTITRPSLNSFYSQFLDMSYRA